ncbi:MAG: hypothetical protein ACI9OJ_004217 [Myxococcota bacterium]|jgi:hypothetical protein
MNWDAIGAVSELSGVVAVVVSMLILAFQIRESNRVAKAEAIRARGERMVDVWFRVAESDRIATAIDAAFFEEKSLTEMTTEAQRTLYAVVRALALLWESEYLEHRHGGLDDQVWHARLGTISMILEKKPAYDAIWSDVTPILTREFTRQIEQTRAGIQARAAQAMSGSDNDLKASQLES